MKYLLNMVMGGIIFCAFNLYAADTDQTVRIEEILHTTRLYTKVHILDDVGFGQGGIPVAQTHTFESVSVVDDHFAGTQKKWSEDEIAQALLQKKAVSVKLLGRRETKPLQEGESLSEVRKTVTLLTTHPGLELSIEGVEILKGRDGKQRLKLLVGLKNLTHHSLNLTQNSFKEGDFFLEQVSSPSKQTSVVIGRVIYDLPEIHGFYTLDIPTP